MAIMSLRLLTRSVTWNPAIVRVLDDGVQQCVYPVRLTRACQPNERCGRSVSNFALEAHRQEESSVEHAWSVGSTASSNRFDCLRAPDRVCNHPLFRFPGNLTQPREAV